MSNYELLVKTLDNLSGESPDSLHVYHPSSDEEKIHCRSRCLIHLFLRVHFGILDFQEAENFITDGTNDGGLDAYYVDESEKIIYLIQSKFANSEQNFENNPVNGYEMFRMYLDRIVNGETTDTNGLIFNGKINAFQRKIQQISDIGRYTYILVYLGNISNSITNERLLEVCGNACSEVDRYDGKTFYKNILLPYIQSDFYNKKELILKIKVNQNQSNRINYYVNVSGRSVGINLCFVPTLEIARMMKKYTNSLLRFNPRCYVGIVKGGVNNAIQGSLANTDSNEFSVLNNGITIVCSKFLYTDGNGEQGSATLQITNPQLVNGGQTAYTLSNILEIQGEDIFNNKEVLVKFISLDDDDINSQLSLIEKISEATNNQTPVNLSDRRSNHDILISIQDDLFNNFGVIFERKRGEFFRAVKDSLIVEKDIIKKDHLLKLFLSTKGMVSEARNFSTEKLFKNIDLEELGRLDMRDLYNCILIYSEIVNKEINTRSRKERYRTSEYGNSLRYGKYSVTYVVFSKIDNNFENINSCIDDVLASWLDYETTISNKETNSEYYDDGFNFDNYYKGNTINEDLKEYYNL